jgi:pentatricopeptide repeat protein
MLEQLTAAGFAPQLRDMNIMMNACVQAYEPVRAVEYFRELGALRMGDLQNG